MNVLSHHTWYLALVYYHAHTCVFHGGSVRVNFDTALTQCLPLLTQEQCSVLAEPPVGDV